MLKKTTTIAVVLGCCCNLFAATYWISPEGRPSGTGSETDPFVSAEAALKKVAGGNTFIFKPGNYIGTQITLSAGHAGSAQKPTILKSQNKYEAVLHGSLFHNIYIKRGLQVELPGRSLVPGECPADDCRGDGHRCPCRRSKRGWYPGPGRRWKNRTLGQPLRRKEHL